MRMNASRDFTWAAGSPSLWMKIGCSLPSGCSHSSTSLCRKSGAELYVACIFAFSLRQVLTLLATDLDTDVAKMQGSPRAAILAICFEVFLSVGTALPMFREVFFRLDTVSPSSHCLPSSSEALLSVETAANRLYGRV